jgi:hypothetical protein
MCRIFTWVCAVILVGLGGPSTREFTPSAYGQEKAEVEGGGYGGGGGKLVLLRKIAGTLSSKDDKQSNDGSYYNGYLFKVQQGRKYYVRMTSVDGDFKPFFWVRGLANIDDIDGRRALFQQQATGKELWCWFVAGRTRQLLFIANTEKAGQTGNYVLEIYTDK